MKKVCILPDRRLSLALLKGDVDLGELLALEASQAQDPDFHASMDQLLVCKPGTRFMVSVDELRSFALRKPIFSGTSRRAMCVAASVEGIVGLYKQLRGNATGQIKLFRTVPEACRYLQIPGIELHQYINAFESETSDDEGAAMDYSPAD